jgi:predicted TIM-barrel fold metal-dependent hydrolase
MRTAFFVLICFLTAGGSLNAADSSPLYKTKYRVINVHRHSSPPSDGAARAEIDVLDRVGMSTSIVLDAVLGDDANLRAWADVKKKHGGRILFFVKPDFRRAKEKTFFEDIVRDLERAARAGAQGVKVWKDVGMYLRDADGKLLKSDDPRLDPFWDKCGELGLPVLIHAADPREYWYPLTYNSFHYGLRAEKDQHYHNPEMPKWEELIRQRDAVLRKHPKTQFVGAHFGSLDLDLKQLADAFEKYPNFSVDTAARQRILGRLNPNAVRDFFIKYQDRIVFGTDDMILSKGRKQGGSNVVLYPSEDPTWMWIEPTDTAAVKTWQDRAASDYAQYLEYFETDRLDLRDPNRSGGAWLRIPGIKLPADVLEKVYHTNAERLIPGLKK